MKLKTGDTFYLEKGPGKPYKCHVRGVVDGGMIVYRWYGRHKQWWHYEVERVNYLADLIKIMKDRHGLK